MKHRIEHIRREVILTTCFECGQEVNTHPSQCTKKRKVKPLDSLEAKLSPSVVQEAYKEAGFIRAQLEKDI